MNTKFLMLTALILALCACSKTPSDQIANYQGGQLLRSELESYIGSLPVPRRLVDPEDVEGWWLRQAQNALVDEILALEMDLLGIGAEPEFEQLKHDFVRDTLAKQWLRERLNAIQISQADLEQAFEDRKQEFSSPATRNIGNIFLSFFFLIVIEARPANWPPGCTNNS